MQKDMEVETEMLMREGKIRHRAIKAGLERGHQDALKLVFI